LINFLITFNLNLMVFIQNLGNWLLPVMNFFTFLGQEEFYLLVMPAIFWCVDSTLGIRLGFMLLMSANLNSILKWIFHMPRPYWVFPENISAYQIETSFGMPSGHAQNAMSLWGLIAKKNQRKWSTVIFSIVILAIGFSRLYLGVHSVYDIVIGWLVGYLLLWIYIRYEARVIKWFHQFSYTKQLLLIFLASLLCIVIGYGIATTFSHSAIPRSWLINAIAEDPAHQPFNPFSIKGLISNAAVFFGLMGGVLILTQKEPYHPSGKIWQRILQYLIGLLGVIVIWAGLRMIFPDGETFIPMIFRYIRYFLVGFWVSWGAPNTFIKLNLK